MHTRTVGVIIDKYSMSFLISFYFFHANTWVLSFFFSVSACVILYEWIQTELISSSFISHFLFWFVFVQSFFFFFWFSMNMYVSVLKVNWGPKYLLIYFIDEFEPSVCIFFLLIFPTLQIHLIVFHLLFFFVVILISFFFFFMFSFSVVDVLFSTF